MEGALALSPLSNRKKYAYASLTVAFACLRLCHLKLLWADEDYHLAAAINILNGRIPYRDFWYDKPPLCAVYYSLNAGYAGWSLRLLDAGYILLGCWLLYRLARAWWSETEGWAAALLFAFFTAFYLPSAVIPFAADALMIVPHLAAVYSAYKKRPLQSGIWCGVAFLFNTKGLFVVAVCVLWLLPEVLSLLLGFALPLIAALIAGWLSGALPGYWQQVWRWSLIYAEQSPVTHPVILGIRRTADWLGFHAALAAGAVFALLRMGRAGRPAQLMELPHKIGNDRWRLATWLALSFAAVCLGTRFAPHYYLQILPAMVILASRGVVLAYRRYGRAAVILWALLLLVPFIRFGPRYVSLAADAIEHKQPQWSDIVLDEDSCSAARKICSLARPGDTLFVWGYRPDIYVYTRMVSDSLFGDSQPLTGVPADRHLKTDVPVYSTSAALNRLQLVRSHPTFIVDGLGLLNPKLAPTVYPELRPWLAGYRLVGRTKLSLIYRRAE
jgi:hypothetical protein